MYKYITRVICPIQKADLSLRAYCSNFGSKMSEALENLKQKQDTKPKTLPYKSRYNGRVKKRQWEDSKTEENSNSSSTSGEKRIRIKIKKCAILLGYSGVNYFGMQRNPGMKTIEEELFIAMLKNKWITEEGFNQAQHVQFQRAARTDKGVSAARQCCSIKLPEDINIENLNDDLPSQIRVFNVKRVTKGFNSKDQCNARTYTYTLPTLALENYKENIDMLSFRINKEKLENFNNILKMFEGTKNFHNFTCRKEYLDPSSKRYIMSFKCDEPFLSPNQIEFVTLEVKGQSFMMHQIRKMVGLSLAVQRGHTTQETITRSFTEERLDIPMAPGLGLVLDRVHYDNYNKRYGEDGIHEPLDWEKEEPIIKEFVDNYIYSTIFEKELNEKSMINWLETLGFHSYDVRENENVRKEEVENEIVEDKKVENGIINDKEVENGIINDKEVESEQKKQEVN